MVDKTPSIRAIARALGVYPSTVMRWKRDKPAMYKLALEHWRETEGDKDER